MLKAKQVQRTLFVSDFSYTPYKKINHAAILCENEKITAIGSFSAFKIDSEMDVYDLRGSYAVPGFIDTHIHGSGGFDSSTADEELEDFSLMTETLGRHGVTSFIPTIVSCPQAKLLSCTSAFVNIMNKKYNGAVPLGIRIEGPYINKLKKGSQNKDFIREIDLGEARELIQAGQGIIKIMTFAPELKRSTELIELLLENNIIPSMGHTMAEEDTVIRAIDAGATHCTHIYNGMPPFHHRSIGIAGVVLTDDRVAVEVILDGYHIHPRMIDIVCRIKPKDKIIGISDAIQGAGLQDGKYHLAKIDIIVKNGRSSTYDGVIAGTTLTLERGWDHLVRYTKLGINEAAACLTSNPAKLLGEYEIGELRPGKYCDVTFFNTETNQADMTIRHGNIIYSSKRKTFKIENTNEFLLSNIQ